MWRTFSQQPVRKLSNPHNSNPQNFSPTTISRAITNPQLPQQQQQQQQQPQQKKKRTTSTVTTSRMTDSYERLQRRIAADDEAVELKLQQVAESIAAAVAANDKSERDHWRSRETALMQERFILIQERLTLAQTQKALSEERAARAEERAARAKERVELATQRTIAMQEQGELLSSSTLSSFFFNSKCVRAF
jgi:ABC-type Na+ efflux pump permease subunit